MMTRGSIRFAIAMALTSAVAAVGYDVSQILQVAGVLNFPVDLILIYGFSLFIAPPFMIAMAALHYAVPADKKVWTLAGLMFAVLYGAMVSLVYLTELTVTIPETLAGRAEAVRFITLTDRSFFCTVDALGYAFMSLATLVSAGAFDWRGRSGALKAVFLVHGVQAPVIVLILFRPELLLLGLPWIVTGPLTMILTARYLAPLIKGPGDASPIA